LEKLSLSAEKIVKRGLRIESLDLEEPPKLADSTPKLVSSSS
jgi:hypothetical protein